MTLSPARLGALTLALAGLSAGSGAATAATGSRDLYLNLNLGLSDARLACGAGQDCQQRQLAGKLTLGGFVTERLAVEGRWGQLGNTRVDDPATPAARQVSTTRHGLGLGAALWQEFNPRTYGVLRAGLASERVDTRTEAADGSRQDRHARYNAPYAGLGALQAFAPKAHWVADLDLLRSRDGAGERRRVLALTLGVGLRF